MLPKATYPTLIGAVSAFALLAAAPAYAATSQSSQSDKEQPAQTTASQGQPQQSQTGGTSASQVQGQTRQSQTGQGGTIDIASWDNAPLYDGLSAANLLDEDVVGENGEEIGEIEDFIVSKDGKIKAVVIEGGGFWDIGDTHLRLDWEKVRQASEDGIVVPLTEGALEDREFLSVDDFSPAEGNFRVRELIGDTVRTSDDGVYGYVRDVVFSRDGGVMAVLVQADYTYGVPGWRALPYYGGYYDPYSPYYSVPYAVDDLNELEEFEYDRLGRG